MAYLEIDLHSAIIMACERLGLRPQTWRGLLPQKAKLVHRAGRNEPMAKNDGRASKRTSQARCVNLL
jgi:hypothetical protein